MLDANRISHKGLRRLVASGDASGIQAEWLPRVRKILAALNAATSPQELNWPGSGWHELKGDRRGTYAMTVTRNWRLTFMWDEDGPRAIDLEDYHGR